MRRRTWRVHFVDEWHTRFGRLHTASFTPFHVWVTWGTFFDFTFGFTLFGVGLELFVFPE